MTHRALHDFGFEWFVVLERRHVEWTGDQAVTAADANGRIVHDGAFRRLGEGAHKTRRRARRFLAMVALLLAKDG